MAYKSSIQDIKRKSIRLYSADQKRDVYRRYADRCNAINCDPDKVIVGKHAWGYNEDTVWHMVNMIVTIDTLLYIFHNQEEIAIWFRRPIEAEPFEGRCPLLLVQSDMRNAALLRFYTNGLMADYDKYYALPDPSTFQDEYINTID